MVICGRLSYNFTILVSVIVAVEFLIHVQGQGSKGHQHGGYKAPCSNSAPCDGARNFSCDAESRRCLCAPHPEPNMTFIFDIHIHGCVPLKVEQRDAFWECEDYFYIATRSVNETGLGFCKSDHECHTAHNSSGLHCNHSTCSCECSVQHPQTGLRLVQQATVTENKCVHQPIECQDDPDCVAEYGDHSSCNRSARQCQCVGGAEFFQGKCVQGKKFGENCTDELECQLGLGRHAGCSSNSSVCECDDGFGHTSGVSGAGRCIRALNSPRKDVKEPSSGFGTPLIVLACLSALSVATLFTLVWFIRNKRKAKHYRLRQATGLELASCRSSASTVKFDPLDEKNFL